MTADLFGQVRAVAAGVFQMETAGLTEHSSPETVEVWDSVQHLNLVLALEEKFGLQFEPEEMDGMKSLGQIAALVGTKLS